MNGKIKLIKYLDATSGNSFDNFQKVVKTNSIKKNMRLVTEYKN
jgi:hypothetical protein